MKIYIVGNDGSGTEYEPSIEITPLNFEDLYSKEQWSYMKKCNFIAQKTKAFLNKEKAVAYYNTLTNGEKYHAITIGEIEIEE